MRRCGILVAGYQVGKILALVDQRVAVAEQSFGEQASPTIGQGEFLFGRYSRETLAQPFFPAGLVEQDDSGGLRVACRVLI